MLLYAWLAVSAIVTAGTLAAGTYTGQIVNHQLLQIHQYQHDHPGDTARSRRRVRRSSTMLFPESFQFLLHDQRQSGNLADGSDSETPEPAR